MNAIVAKQVDDAHDPKAPAGAYTLVATQDRPDQFVGMEFKCPCGCGTECYVGFRGFGPRPSWIWDGDEARPSLSPSVYNSGLPCKWHGWLKKGIWQTC